MRSGAHRATALHGLWQVTNREALSWRSQLLCSWLWGTNWAGHSLCRESLPPWPGAGLGFEKLRPGLESDLLSPTAGT